MCKALGSILPAPHKQTRTIIDEQESLRLIRFLPWHSGTDILFSNFNTNLNVLHLFVYTVGKVLGREMCSRHNTNVKLRGLGSLHPHVGPGGEIQVPRGGSSYLHPLMDYQGMDFRVGRLLHPLIH